jgi:K+-sensing histidine kinase KdpD
VDCVNIETDMLANIALGAGPIGKVAQTGAAYFGTADAHNPIACIPLKVTDQITGVIVVFALLEQKLELRTGDRELLEWLSLQAGLALHRATIQTAWRAANGVDG